MGVDLSTAQINELQVENKRLKAELKETIFKIAELMAKEDQAAEDLEQAQTEIKQLKIRHEQEIEVVEG